MSSSQKVTDMGTLALLRLDTIAHFCLDTVAHLHLGTIADLHLQMHAQITPCTVSTIDENMLLDSILRRPLRSWRLERQASLTFEVPTTKFFVAAATIEGIVQRFHHLNLKKQGTQGGCSHNHKRLLMFFLSHLSLFPTLATYKDSARDFAFSTLLQ